MAQIAKAAGVAKSTVSLALRNDLRVSPAQRKRIQRIATKMGYQTNALVARLMYELRASGKGRFVATLAILNCNPDQDIAERNPAVKKLCEGIALRARELGYAVDSFWLRDPGVSIERLASILRSRGIQGVIFHAFGVDADLMDLDPEGVLWNHFAAVTAGVRLRHPPLSFSTNDHYETGFQLSLNLQRLGYKRPGIVIEEWVNERLDRRFVYGFLAACKDTVDAVPPLYMKGSGSAEGNSENDREDFVKWLQNNKPDACGCLNRYIPDWLDELRIRYPEDMGVAFLDLSDATAGMAGMDQRKLETGKSAVDVLIGQIHRNESSPPSSQHGVLVESLWRMGSGVRSA